MSENEENLENVRNKVIEVSAKTVEEAVEQGLDQLNLTQDEVEVDILKEGKRGVFGIGAEDAVVRLTPKVVEAPISEPTISPEPSLPSESEETAPSDDKQRATESEPETTSDIDALAEEYLAGLLKRMGIKARIERGNGEDLVEPGEEVPLVLDIQGQDLGILIGRRSETLRALQYMLRLMVSKQISRWYPIIVDVESYRVRRRNSLRQLADKMAQRAVSSGRRVVLEAMPAYERRIVHITLRDHPDVYTKSVGGDDNRKVTIIPK